MKCGLYLCISEHTEKQVGQQVYFTDGFGYYISEEIKEDPEGGRRDDREIWFVHTFLSSFVRQIRLNHEFSIHLWSKFEPY